MAMEFWTREFKRQDIIQVQSEINTNYKEDTRHNIKVYHDKRSHSINISVIKEGEENHDSKIEVEDTRLKQSKKIKKIWIFWNFITITFMIVNGSMGVSNFGILVDNEENCAKSSKQKTDGNNIKEKISSKRLVNNNRIHSYKDLKSKRQATKKKLLQRDDIPVKVKTCTKYKDKFRIRKRTTLRDIGYEEQIIQ